MDKGKILSDTVGLFGRRILAMVVTVLTTYGVARLLGPTNYGLLAAFAIVPTLSAYGTVGWDQAAMRELPHLRGLGNEARVKTVRSTAYTAELSLTGCWIAAAVAVAMLQTDPMLRIGMLLAAVSLLVTKISRFFTIDTYLDKDFRLQARIGAAVSMVTGALELLAAWQLGAVGTFGAIVVGNSIGLLLYRQARPLRLKLRLDLAELRRLTSIGLPMAILSLLAGANGVLIYINRAVLGTQAGLEVLGLCVFAMSISGYIMGFADDFITAYQPHLYESLATATGAKAVTSWVTKPSQALVYAAALTSSGALCVLPTLISQFLPRYQAIVPLLPVFFLPVLLNAVYHVPGVFLYSAFANQQVHYAKVWAVADAAYGLVLFALVRAGLGLTGAAWALVVPSVIVAFGTLRRAHRYYAFTHEENTRHLLSQLLPLAYVFALFFVSAQEFTRAPSLTGAPLVDDVILRVSLFVLAASPILVLMNRSFRLRKVMWIMRASLIGN